MIATRYDLQLLDSMKKLLPFLLMLATAATALAAGNTPDVTSGTATGTVGVAFSYQIVATSNFTIISYNATGLPSGLAVNTSSGLISGTPTAAGTYNVTITATNNRPNNNTGSGTLALTIFPPPAFVGFRLPDFQMSAGSPNAPRLMLQMGATSATPNPFNVVLEVDAGGGTWVPYNRFVGIDDPASWITNAPLAVRDSLVSSGSPRPFESAQLTQSPPGVYMKADPRSTRFGIFEMDTNPTTSSRIMLSGWPSASSTVPNGFGGAVGTAVQHIPNRFASADYYPATLSINDGQANSIRNTATTNYADNDGIVRPGDAVYPDPTRTSTGSSTPWSSYTVSGTPLRPYWPIMLNRPFRNVAELGYVFRDLPWKSLDFFSDKSADAGLLDIFTINDGTPLLNGATVVGMAVPATVAGLINLNTRQSPVLQSVLAGTIWDETTPTNYYSKTTGTTPPAPDSAQTMAPLVVSATSTTPALNRSELVSRAGLPNQVLPVYTGATANQTDQLVKAQREAVPRALSSVSQTRVWNLLIDVVAQSGRYAPGETDLSKFIVEGEQYYWVHVAIDRLTGEVIDRQIEPVNE